MLGRVKWGYLVLSVEILLIGTEFVYRIFRAWHFIEFWKEPFYRFEGYVFYVLHFENWILSYSIFCLLVTVWFLFLQSLPMWESFSTTFLILSSYFSSTVSFPFVHMAISV